MADQQNLDPVDERYRFIGFEVYPTKTGPFWKSEDERKSYVASIKQQIGSIYRNSVVYSSVITRVDRLFIIIASVVMIVAPFLPWMRAHTLYGPVSFGGITGLLNLGGFWFYVDKMGGWVILLTVYLLAAMAVLSVVLGVFVLITIFGKASSEEAYAKKLKKVLRLNAIGFLLFLAIVLLGLIGQRIPFGQHLGIEELGPRYTIVTFVQLAHIGMWLSVFAFIINFNKSKEL